MVDCGGGTVDIISYKVTSIKPMKVCEIVQGQGKLKITRENRRKLMNV